MKFKIRALLSEPLLSTIETAVSQLKEVLSETGDFNWVNSDEYFIELGSGSCGVLSCTKLYDQLYAYLGSISDWSISIGDVRRGLGLYHADILYFTLNRGGDTLRSIVSDMQNFGIKIPHPFVPRITVAHMQLNYGHGTSHNLASLIQQFNEALHSDDRIQTVYKIQAIGIYDIKRQEFTKKFLVS